MITVTYWTFFFLVIGLFFVCFLLLKVWEAIHADELKKQDEKFQIIFSEKQDYIREILAEKNRTNHRLTLLKQELNKKEKALLRAKSASARKSKKIRLVHDTFLKCNSNLDEWIKDIKAKEIANK